MSKSMTRVKELIERLELAEYELEEHKEKFNTLNNVKTILSNGTSEKAKEIFNSVEKYFSDHLSEAIANVVKMEIRVKLAEEGLKEAVEEAAEKAEREVE